MASSSFENKLNELLGSGLTGVLESLFAQMDWAEEEVERAQKRHSKDADKLYHAFQLLHPAHERMATEFVYRSHVRELLGRVIRDEDTRPATWAEIVCACSEASHLAPMTGACFGAYARAWNEARFPMAFPDQADTLRHVEALHSSGIDDILADLRRKLAVKDRKVMNVKCRGYHHGEAATGCRYYQDNAQTALPMIVTRLVSSIRQTQAGRDRHR